MLYWLPVQSRLLQIQLYPIILLNKKKIRYDPRKSRWNEAAGGLCLLMYRAKKHAGTRFDTYARTTEESYPWIQFRNIGAL